MPSPFNPVHNPLVLLREGTLLLIQRVNDFVVVRDVEDNVVEVSVASNIEEAMNEFCRHSSDAALMYDEMSASGNEVVCSYVEAFDTSGQALDWDEVNRDIFGNEVDFNDQRL